MRAIARRRLVSVGAAALATTALVSAYSVAHAMTAPTPPTTSLEGKLLMAHGDTFNGAPMGMSADLRTKTGTVHLRIPYTRHEQFARFAGKHVRVSGNGTAAAFNATNVAPETAADAAVTPAPHQMRVAVFMLHARGSTAEPISKTQAQATFFGGANSAADWYAQTSSNQVQMTGTVYGYYDNTYDPGSCGDLFTLLHTLVGEGETAAAADGYKAANFDYSVVYLPDMRTCGFAGVAWIGASGVVLNGDMSITVITHELGHNLGLSHAGSYTCGLTQLTSSSCVADYGDPNDVMGTSHHQYNAAHKVKLGWIPQSEVQTVTSGTQTIALTASENDVSPGAIDLIEVPGGSLGTFAIERRASIGSFDQGMSGVYVRLIRTQNTDDTVWLPMPQFGSVSNGSLAPGESYTNSAANITITTLSDTPGSATASVQVCVGPCGSGGATTTTSATTTSSSSSTTTSTSTTTTIPNGNSAVSVHVTRGRIIVTGTDGNDTVHLTKMHDNVKTVDANGAPISVGQGCTMSTTATIATAVCHGAHFEVAMGGGNDTVIVAGHITSRSTIDGGSGDDTFVPGYGPETFIGGEGFDTVDYSGRPPGTVTAVIGGGAHSGVKRDRQTIGADIERVIVP